MYRVKQGRAQSRASGLYRKIELPLVTQ
jgi:hypothetical protein